MNPTTKARLMSSAMAAVACFAFMVAQGAVPQIPHEWVWVSLPLLVGLGSFSPELVAKSEAGAVAAESIVPVARAALGATGVPVAMTGLVNVGPLPVVPVASQGSAPVSAPVAVPPGPPPPAV